MASKLEVLRAILAPRWRVRKLLGGSWRALGGSGLQEPNMGPTVRRMDTLRPPSWTPSWTHVEDCNPPKTPIFLWFLQVFGYQWLYDRSLLALLELSKPIDITLISKAKMFKNH